MDTKFTYRRSPRPQSLAPAFSPCWLFVREVETIERERYVRVYLGIPGGCQTWLSYRTVCISTPPRLSHPSRLIFRGRYLHGWNIAGAKKVGVGIISPRAFRRRTVRYWHWHPLGCRAIELGEPPKGGGGDVRRRRPYRGHARVCTRLHNLQYESTAATAV